MSDRPTLPPTRAPRPRYRLPRFHRPSRRWRLTLNYADGAGKDFWWPAADGGAGPPPAEVVARAVEVQRHWETLVAGWGVYGAMLSAAEPGRDWSAPRWVEPAALEDAHRAVATAARRSDAEADRDAARRLIAPGGLARVLALIGTPDAFALAAAAPAAASRMIAAGRPGLLRAHDEDRERERAAALADLNPAIARRAVRPTRVADAIDAYVADQRQRVGLAGGDGIRPETFASDRGNLMRAFGLSGGPGRAVLRRTPIGPDDLLHAIDRERLVGFARYWQAMPDGIRSPRTVKNLFASVRAFLAWAGRQPMGWEKVDDLGAVLAADGTARVPLRADVAMAGVRATLAQGGDRLRAYALFGLLLGYLPKDIATMRLDEVETAGGEVFVKRSRSKEGGGSRRKRRGERTLLIRHWIAPELWQLARRLHRPNAGGLLLLNRHGLPMSRTAADGSGRRSAADRAWNRARERGGLRDAPSFSQLRKVGFNAIKRHAGSREVAEVWAGHSGAIADHYDDGVFEPVVAAQRAWAAELRAGGLL